MGSVKDSGRGKEFGRKTEILKNRGYLCLERLGQGAFSEVYRIEDRDGNAYACKISGNIRMLEREAKIMKGLEHPLFPKYFGLWTQEEWGFLVMEYIPGSSLENMLGRRGSFSARQTARTGMELAEGLLYLHERREKYLFQDVKPANIMVRQDGRIKLLDFGCVYFAGEKRPVRAGTPGYAAPGQLDGREKPTEACDVYGLGKTLEEMLNGRGGAPESGKYGNRKQGDRRYGKRYKKELEQLLEACTRQEASGRISNMRDVLAALAGLEGAENWAWRREASCRKNIWECMYKKT